MSDRLSPLAPQALALLRIMTGLLFMQHGTQKLLGFPAPLGEGGALPPLMLVGGILELFGGLLIVVGLLTRPVAFVLSGMMAVAYFMFHAAGGGFYPILNGGELAILFSFVFLYLFVAGPGAWSLDGLMGRGAGAARAA